MEALGKPRPPSTPRYGTAATPRDSDGAAAAGGDVREPPGRWNPARWRALVAFAMLLSPGEMGIGPVYAIPRRSTAGLSLDQIEPDELNEAFAAQFRSP